MTANSKYSYSTKISVILRIVINMLTRELLADETRNSLVERFEQLGPVPERRNNSIPGINVPYFRE